MKAFESAVGAGIHALETGTDKQTKQNMSLLELIIKQTSTYRETALSCFLTFVMYMHAHWYHSLTDSSRTQR